MDALDACLARIQQCQPVLNAFVMVDADNANFAAAASSQRWARGKPLSPLDGIPISLKDNLHAAGMPTTWGSSLLQGFVPRHDELPVARLRAAGAVFLGKTNLPEFAMQGYTTNAVAGTSCNPWDVRLSPGGSSGGAAAAVAAGCGPIALATDGGGSIRRPASHCGLVGYKPSEGLVPRGGGLPELFLNHEVVGGITRSVLDARSVMAVLAGADLPTSLPSAAKILFIPRFAAHPVDAAIAAQVQQATQQFEALGHQVTQAPAFEMAESVNASWSLLSATGLAWLMGNAAAWHSLGMSPGQLPDESLCSDASRASLQAGRVATAADLFDLMEAVQQLKRDLAEKFERYDFILTPATAALPWPIAQTHPPEIADQAVGPRGHAVFTGFVNAAGLPAIALPCAPVGGLPCGFQLVGRIGADAALLDLAAQYEQACPWADKWPSI